MIDPVAAALAAVESQAPQAFAVVFCAGAATSIGPCVAPRYVAIAAIVHGHQRPVVPTLCFVLGLVGAFAAVGFVAGLLGALWSLSSALYLLLAGGLIGGGCITLVRARPHQHTIATTVEDPARKPASAEGSACKPAPRSWGAFFLLGAASALIVSPCCTPLVAAVVATTTTIGKPLVGAALLASFAAGHAVPLILSAKLGDGVVRFAHLHAAGQAPAIVSAVLMLALGIYYGVLA